MPPDSAGAPTPDGEDVGDGLDADDGVGEGEGVGEVEGLTVGDGVGDAGDVWAGVCGGTGDRVGVASVTVGLGIAVGLSGPAFDRVGRGLGVEDGTSGRVSDRVTLGIVAVGVASPSPERVGVADGLSCDPPPWHEVSSAASASAPARAPSRGDLVRSSPALLVTLDPLRPGLAGRLISPSPTTNASAEVASWARSVMATTTRAAALEQEREMTTFTVWKFEDPDGAGRAASVLKDAASEGLVKVLDHAVVAWPPGAARPTTKHGHEDMWRASGWGAFWGMLCGALFFVPVIGGVAGAAIGAMSQATDGVGIRKDDLEKIRAEVTEGTSALFAVTDEGNLDRLGDRFIGMHSKLIDTNLTDAERRILLETFGD